MDVWTIGIVVVLALGVAVILFGALWDRRRNQRAAREMLSPPAREIPHFAPETQVPHYLSELQARRRPTSGSSAGLGSEEREAIRRQLADPATPTIPVGAASTDFVTDQATGWTVLEHPYVLVCAEPVETMREILGPLEKVLPTGAPLVIIAPRLRDEVKSTLEVNAIQHTMALVAIEADEESLRRVTELTGATALPRSDLQSGYAGLDRLGRCPRWVSTSTASYLPTGDEPNKDATTDRRRTQP